MLLYRSKGTFLGQAHAGSVLDVIVFIIFGMLRLVLLHCTISFLGDVLQELTRSTFKLEGDHLGSFSEEDEEAKLIRVDLDFVGFEDFFDLDQSSIVDVVLVERNNNCEVLFTFDAIDDQCLELFNALLWQGVLLHLVPDRIDCDFHRGGIEVGHDDCCVACFCCFDRKVLLWDGGKGSLASWLRG